VAARRLGQQMYDRFVRDVQYEVCTADLYDRGN
jgi:hypothetical protein